jgi:hypothetical protein
MPKTGVKECKGKCKRWRKAHFVSELRFWIKVSKTKMPFFTPKTHKKRQNTEGVF